MRCLLALLIGGALCTALADQAWAQTLPPPVPETEQQALVVQELVVQGRARRQGRLDEAVRPLAYRLDLTLDPSQPRWIVSHLGELTATSDSTFLTHQLPAALGRFCSADRADQIARDLRSRLADTPAALALERTIERMRNCGFFDREMGSQINLGFTKAK